MNHPLIWPEQVFDVARKPVMGCCFVALRDSGSGQYVIRSTTRFAVTRFRGNPNAQAQECSSEPERSRATIVCATVTPTFGTRSMPQFLGRFLPWPAVSRWPLSLRDDAQVELSYEFSFAVPSLSICVKSCHSCHSMSAIFRRTKRRGASANVDTYRTCFLAIWSPAERAGLRSVN